MKKILIVSTVSRQFYLFEQGNIEVLKSLGYEVHGAANFSDANERLDALDIACHHCNIQRSPFSLKNIAGYRQLKKVMKTENFNAVHCHSPMGGVLARLAAKSVGINPVLYTAHGFHFYKGAPLINWLIYYLVEKFLSRHTDVLITINKEDYDRAQSFKAKKVKYVPGIGINTSKFNRTVIDIQRKRDELGISKDTVVLLTVGEMIKRKNHETALKAIAKLNSNKLVYLICGKGELEDYLKGLVKSLNIEDRVRFLGFRNDIPEICMASDIFIFPSYQEGLPVAMMEAMSAGLPVVCSDIRGNTDLVENKKNGYMIKPDDIDGFVNAIQNMLVDRNLRQRMGAYNSKVIKKFSIENVNEIMKSIYGAEIE